MAQKKCWQCAEMIQAEALVCPLCHAKQRLAYPMPKSEGRMHPALIAVAAVAVVFVAGVAMMIETREPAAEPSRSTPIADQYGGCLMRGLGNQSPNFAGLVKRRLRNPASFEHVETTVGPVKDGVFPATMTYRATNGFGGVDTYTAAGLIEVAGCKAKVLAVE